MIVRAHRKSPVCPQQTPCVHTRDFSCARNRSRACAQGVSCAHKSDISEAQELLWAYSAHASGLLCAHVAREIPCCAHSRSLVCAQEISCALACEQEIFLLLLSCCPGMDAGGANAHKGPGAGPISRLQSSDRVGGCWNEKGRWWSERFAHDCRLVLCGWEMLVGNLSRSSSTLDARERSADYL